MGKFYITTTLPYVNADPHLGFALEIVQADVIARYHAEVLKQDVFFNTDTDEHGIKIYRKAQEEGKEVQAYVDEYAAKFKQLKRRLGLFDDLHFIRTTDEHHNKAAQEFWEICNKNGYIYKDSYKVKYCVGCELEKTDSELNEEGHCLLHPNLMIELIDEKNYFFKFADFQQKLLDYYSAHSDFVVPDFRFNEIIQFVKAGLANFSISRVKEKMPWGVPVPGDDTQVMYVWFDALINYISTLGWPNDKHSFEGFWGTLAHPNGIQIAGKDNLRQQSAMWQAMLMAAGLPNSKQIIIHGFITSDGQKMSKSLGNVADPYQILDKLRASGLSESQAIDTLRYYLLREISPFEDGDYSWGKLKSRHESDLANGLGNLVSRVTTLWEKFGDGKMDLNAKPVHDLFSVDDLVEKFYFHQALQEIWNAVQAANEAVDYNKLWELGKTDTNQFNHVSNQLLVTIKQIGEHLSPFMPETAEKIKNIFKQEKITKAEPLFPRIS